jgi:dihydrofolate synthase/folylpolyglutamate synthase
MNIASNQQAEEILQTYVPEVAAYSGDGMSLKRMWPLLAAVDDPHQKLRAIHIAGTSGKTSTAYFAAAILRASNKKVGLTVSPHVDSITERVQINGSPISEELFCRYLARFLELIRNVSPRPSYFELMVVFVYWVFVQEKVEYAVIETGMGGLLDGTNVIDRPDKVCVITDIGFDHMHVLGKTIPEIAAQKAGIIHKQNDIFMYRQSDAVMSSIQSRVDQKNARLRVVTYAKQPAAQRQLPDFQHRNYTLAHEVCAAVAERDGFALDESFDPSEVVVPGRIEVREEGEKTLVMDGAHNAQKIQTFVSSFQKLFPGQKADVMLALKKGKEYPEAIDSLLPIVRTCIVTTFDTSQDMPAVSQDPGTIQKYLAAKHIKAEVHTSFREAYDVLMSQDSTIKLVIGSFYLLGQLRATL